MSRAWYFVRLRDATVDSCQPKDLERLDSCAGQSSLTRGVGVNVVATVAASIGSAAIGGITEGLSEADAVNAEFAYPSVHDAAAVLAVGAMAVRSGSPSDGCDPAAKSSAPGMLPHVLIAPMRSEVVSSSLRGPGPIWSVAGEPAVLLGGRLRGPCWSGWSTARPAVLFARGNGAPLPSAQGWTVYRLSQVLEAVDGASRAEST